MSRLKPEKILIVIDNKDDDVDLELSYFTGMSSCLRIRDNISGESTLIDTKEFAPFVQTFFMHYYKYSKISLNKEVGQIFIDLPRSTRDCVMDMRSNECIFKSETDNADVRSYQVRVPFTVMERVLSTINSLI